MKIFQKYSKHILMLAVVFLLPVGMASASEGSIKLDLTYVGAGIGYQSGTAVVVLNGKRATFKISGGQFLGGGASNFKATGTVTGARTLADLSGKFSLSRGSISAIVGVTQLSMHNDKGVEIKVSGQNTGIGATVGLGSLTFKRIGAMKNPCNPCSMKKGAMLNPCNPCSMKH
ncbi:MAG: hypothetical protein JKY80_06825 [Mariprofundaceae bacterium]|nr:hypothetical protein [Mariprofundaceae bacterium]